MKQPHIGRHIVFSIVSQAARIAIAANVSPKDFRELAGAAFFNELRKSSPTQKAVAEQMGISLRKAASVAATIRETFYKVEENVSIPRRIEHLLWAAPASRVRIAQVLPSYSSSELSLAIDKLIDEGRIKEDTTSRTALLSVTRGEARLVKDDWVSRLDGVENFMRNAGNSVWQRFFGDRTMSMARTVSVGIRKSDLSELTALYEDIVWPRLVELEKKSMTANDVVEIDMSMIWAEANFETLTNKEKEE